ncbi:hypothetical protein LY78DRAFT_664687 [Colletotrichum sublineola]|nr:hypothetical protein LY78DRAFT_664687 [Colletotrichum sublineola]
MAQGTSGREGWTRGSRPTSGPRPRLRHSERPRRHQKKKERKKRKKEKKKSPLFGQASHPLPATSGPTATLSTVSTVF